MTTQIVLHPESITAAAFAPYGELVEPTDDGVPFGPDDARLDLSGGTPRLYIMHLPPRALSFTRITRHARVTQCLAAMGGREWFIAVAPPIVNADASLAPEPDAIRAFRIPGTVAIKLHRGSWHAGPFFNGPAVDFLNLELSDTNEIDHLTCRLDSQFGLTYRFEV